MFDKNTCFPRVKVFACRCHSQKMSGFLRPLAIPERGTTPKKKDKRPTISPETFYGSSDRDKK